ncbi:MAG: hypothetical protein GY777_22390 [Candidatus Brocadiaceae bacterium]|nr:hypothetical protein [Candidatus Brocadiaceae bacterium]
MVDLIGRNRKRSQSYTEDSAREELTKMASDSVIDTAYEELCKRREDYSHNDEVWDIRFKWAEFKLRSFKGFDTVGWHGQTKFVHATTQVSEKNVAEG